MTTVNNLVLPNIIVDLIQCNRWKMPNDPTLLCELFDDFASPCESSGPTLYTLTQMESETAQWLSFARANSALSGVPDQNKSPGDIDPSRTVLIGDIGIGFDQPFAIDYRTSSTNPCVIHFISPAGQTENRWVMIAPTIESFINTLKL